jgi:hypothetical protein
MIKPIQTAARGTVFFGAVAWIAFHRLRPLSSKDFALFRIRGTARGIRDSIKQPAPAKITLSRITRKKSAAAKRTRAVLTGPGERKIRAGRRPAAVDALQRKRISASPPASNYRIASR